MRNEFQAQLPVNKKFGGEEAAGATVKELVGLNWPSSYAHEGDGPEPADWRQDNTYRASRALGALESYSVQHGDADGETVTDQLILFLADLLHLADTLDLNVHDLLEATKPYYQAEADGQP